MSEQLLKPLVSLFPWQPSEGQGPLQRRAVYFQLAKGKEVFTVILLMETSDKFPQPYRCHVISHTHIFHGNGGGLLTINTEDPRHRMLVIQANKRMPFLMK